MLLLLLAVFKYTNLYVKIRFWEGSIGSMDRQQVFGYVRQHCSTLPDWKEDNLR